MRICNCTLPYTNPNVCITCPNNVDSEDGTNNWHDYWPSVDNYKTVPTKTYDKNGNYTGNGYITKIIDASSIN